MGFTPLALQGMEGWREGKRWRERKKRGRGGDVGSRGRRGASGRDSSWIFLCDSKDIDNLFRGLVPLGYGAKFREVKWGQSVEPGMPHLETYCVSNQT